MTQDLQLKLADLSSLYGQLSSPFSLSNLGVGSASVLLERQPADIPAPLIEAGSVPCPPLRGLSIPEVTICYLPGAIVSQSGAVIYEQKHIISESVEGTLQDNGFKVENDLPHINLDDVVDSDEVVLAISKNGTWNYSLFLSEIVPLALVASMNAATRDLRVPMFFRQFVDKRTIEIRKELVQIFGINEARVFSPEAAFTRYKGVVMVKANDRYKNHRISQLMPYVAGRLKSSLADSLPPVSRRLYISRQTSARKLSNFDEFSERVIKRFGLYAVNLDNMPLADQINLFTKADLVVAEHGAGLVNTMFMRPGSTVVEITPEPMVGRWMYRMISHFGKLNYSFGSFATPKDWVWHKDNIVAPCVLYEHLLGNF